jgi:hypothetical protein
MVYSSKQHPDYWDMSPFTGYPWEYNNKHADNKTINLSLY